jgi:F0F1-type ATP synthase alpha subunit
LPPGPHDAEAILRGVATGIASFTPIGRGQEKLEEGERRSGGIESSSEKINTLAKMHELTRAFVVVLS